MGANIGRAWRLSKQPIRCWFCRNFATSGPICTNQTLLVSPVLAHSDSDASRGLCTFPGCVFFFTRDRIVANVGLWSPFSCKSRFTRHFLVTLGLYTNQICRQRFTVRQSLASPQKLYNWVYRKGILADNGLRAIEAYFLGCTVLQLWVYTIQLTVNLGVRYLVGMYVVYKTNK